MQPLVNSFECVWALLHSFWALVSSYANSNFGAALIGALSGAFGGAYAAQRIAERAKRRETLLQEIRATNVAIIVSFTICNAALSLKKQFTKKMFENYHAQNAAREAFSARRKSGLQSPDLPFDVVFDFESVQMPVVAIDILRTQVFEKISPKGQTLAALSTLDGALASLADTIKKRDIQIERFRALPDKSMALALYFGLPYQQGHVSTEFKDVVDCLHRYNDDAIFFSKLLNEQLRSHGDLILAHYKKLDKSTKEKVYRTDFSQVAQLGLLPDDHEYTDWLNGFADLPETTAPVKKRFRFGWATTKQAKT